MPDSDIGANPATSAHSVSRKMASGALWMVAIRWCVRGLDIVLLIILARLLTSDDFGIFAIATLIAGFLEVLSKAGIDTALIRNPEASAADFNAAWTVQIIQGVVVTLLLLLAAPWLADLFGDPRLQLVIQILALRPLLAAFTNIGIVNFLRDMQYNREFLFGLYRKVGNFIAILGLALVIESYMALVWGTLIGTAISVLASYVMHPQRPRLSIERVRNIWVFSGFMLIYYAAEDLVEKLDRFVVGKIGSTATLGYYHLASQIVHLPIELLFTPMWRALVPGYAKMLHEPDMLRRMFLRILGLTAAVCIGVGFIVAACAEEIILVLLGEQWLPVVPFAQALALVPATAAIVDSAMMVVTVIGRSQLCAWNSGIRLLLLVIVLPLVALNSGVQNIAPAYLLCSLLLIPLAFWILQRVMTVATRDIVSRLWRPVLAGFATLVAVGSVSGDGLSPFLLLPLKLVVAGTAYLLSLTLLWLIAGRPAGPESFVLRMMTGAVRPGEMSQIE